MLNLSLAGNVGRDATYRQTKNGQEICSFPVAVNVGYGENKSTIWIDVTKWGKGANGLANILTKGSKVAVTGQMSTREHEGKTYIQCNAAEITILSAAGERSGQGQRQAPIIKDAPVHEDLDDEIPF